LAGSTSVQDRLQGLLIPASPSAIAQEHLSRNKPTRRNVSRSSPLTVSEWGT
jgi:hypothetical protein